MGNSQQIIITDDPDYYCMGDTVMQFRLTYEGKLYGSSRGSTRAKHKHEIRKIFHKQLKVLWNTHPVISQWYFGHQGKEIRVDEWMAEKVPSIGNYKFSPLVHTIHHVYCGVDILYLRQGAPGQIMQSGDIDNRLKTIFDALKMPSCREQLGGYEEPGENEQLFYCLLQDDALINRASVETDTLYEPLEGDKVEPNDARLIITVDVRRYVPTLFNDPFV